MGLDTVDNTTVAITDSAIDIVVPRSGSGYSGAVLSSSGVSFGRWAIWVRGLTCRVNSPLAFFLSVNEACTGGVAIDIRDSAINVTAGKGTRDIDMSEVVAIVVGGVNITNWRAAIVNTHFAIRATDARAAGLMSASGELSGLDFALIDSHITVDATRVEEGCFVVSPPERVQGCHFAIRNTSISITMTASANAAVAIASVGTPVGVSVVVANHTRIAFRGEAQLVSVASTFPMNDATFDTRVLDDVVLDIAVTKGKFALAWTAVFSGKMPSSMTLHRVVADVAYASSARIGVWESPPDGQRRTTVTDSTFRLSGPGDALFLAASQNTDMVVARTHVHIRHTTGTALQESAVVIVASTPGAGMLAYLPTTSATLRVVDSSFYVVGKGMVSVATLRSPAQLSGANATIMNATVSASSTSGLVYIGSVMAGPGATAPSAAVVVSRSSFTTTSLSSACALVNLPAAAAVMVDHSRITGCGYVGFTAKPAGSVVVSCNWINGDSTVAAQRAAFRGVDHVACTDTATASPTLRPTASRTASRPSTQSAALPVTASLAVTASESRPPTATMSPARSASRDVSPSPTPPSASRTASRSFVAATVAVAPSVIPLRALADDGEGADTAVRAVSIRIVSGTDTYGDVSACRAALVGTNATDWVPLWRGAAAVERPSTLMLRVTLPPLQNGGPQPSSRSDVHLQLSPECFAGRSRVAVVALGVQPPPPPPLVIVAPAATAVAAVATAVSGASGSPSGAVIVARTTLISDLAACDRNVDAELDANSNPTGGVIGDSPVRYYAGAAVYNFALLAGCALLQLAVAGARTCVTKAPFAASVSWVRFPSLTLFPLLYFLQPTTASGFAMLLYGSGFVLPAVGFCIVAAFFAAGVAMYVVIFRNFGGTFVRNDLGRMKRDAEEEAALAGESMARGMLRRLSFFIFAAIGEWEDKAPRTAGPGGGDMGVSLMVGDPAAEVPGAAHRFSFVRCCFLFFADYSDRFTAFILIETGVSFAMGLMGSMAATASIECSQAAWAVLAVLGAYTGIMLWMRPHESRFNFLFMVGMAGCQFLATAFAIANSYAPSDGLLKGVEVLLTCVLVGAMFKALYDVMHVVVGVLRRRTQAMMDRLRAQRRDDEELAERVAAADAADAAAEAVVAAAREAERLAPLLRQQAQKARAVRAIRESEARFVELSALSVAADAQVGEMRAFGHEMNVPPRRTFAGPRMPASIRAGVLRGPDPALDENL
jgi:hypothetical protein